MRGPELTAFLFLDRIPQPARPSPAKLRVRKIGYNDFLRKEFLMEMKTPESLKELLNSSKSCQVAELLISPKAGIIWQQKKIDTKYYSAIFPNRELVKMYT